MAPGRAPRGVMVLVHGFNSHSGYYLWAAEQLLASGLAVYALDLRGRGKSDGERYYVEKFAEYQSDVDVLVKLARANATCASDVHARATARAESSPATTCSITRRTSPASCARASPTGCPRPIFALSVLKGLSHLAPHAHVLKLPKEEFSRDPKVVKALIDDPLLANEVQPTQDRGRNGSRRRAPETRLQAVHAAGTHHPWHEGHGDAAPKEARNSSRTPARRTRR